MFPRDRAGGEEKLASGGDTAARDFVPRFAVQVDDSLGILVEFLTPLGEQHPTALPLEQGRSQRFFEGLDTLTDRRLSQTHHSGSPSEGAQLGRLGEGFQIRQLPTFGFATFPPHTSPPPSPPDTPTT